MADRCTLTFSGNAVFVVSRALADHMLSRGSWLLGLAVRTVVTLRGAGGVCGPSSRSQTLQFIDGFRDEWMRKRHLRSHPRVNFPLNAFLETDKNLNVFFISSEHI